MAEPVLDVILTTHNRLDLTMRAVNALYEHTSVPFHLIVVDDSTDMTPIYFGQALKEKDNITYIHSDIPYKTGNQIFNIGFRHCKTPFAAIVMNSVRVEPDWNVQSMELMNTLPKAGVVGLKNLFSEPDGRIECAGIMMVDSRLTDFGKYAKVSTKTPSDIGSGQPAHRFSANYEVEAVQWAFVLTRVEAVKDLEEFVFNGFKGWDDIDNCFVVRKRGWKIYYCGQSSGYHTPRATRGDNSEEAAQLCKENAHIFFRRWGFWKGKDETRGQNNKKKKVK